MAVMAKPLKGAVENLTERWGYVTDDVRREVENMIEVAVGKFHTQNLERFGLIERGQGELRERIIGIDSNGTGRRPGVLQRQDTMLATMKTQQDDMDTKLNVLLHRSNSWNKQDVWRAVRWFLVFLVSLATLLVAYLAYHAAYHPHEALISNWPTVALQQHSNLY
jgi:hypothetical protein